MERLIFETTALLHPRTIPKLLRVAHRVLVWIEPFLYRIIRVQTPYKPEIRALLRRTPEFCSLAVRHLALLNEGDDVLRLLDTCKGITSLVIPFGAATLDPTTALASILREGRIRRLATRLPKVASDLRCSLFAAITHLAIFDIEPAIILPFCVEIPHLPALTHCSFFLLFSPEVLAARLSQALAETPQLQPLLVLFQSLFERPGVYDVRFVAAKYNSTYWDIWEAGAKGLPDYWSRGDDFVAKKRQGEIAESRYWLD
ncbi:hypothetical protein C8R46DRAFT_1217005 [Mycena filopes]|nr:hypothetical protein C8R46DRAFT_1217005 [Mycena filopes]